MVLTLVLNKRNVEVVVSVVLLSGHEKNAPGHLQNKLSSDPLRLVWLQVGQSAFVKTKQQRKPATIEPICPRLQQAQCNFVLRWWLSFKLPYIQILWEQ